VQIGADFVVVIGVDPHKRTHTASAVDQLTHQRLATVQVEATLAGYRDLLRWGQQFPQRRWAVENAHGLGRHLAQWLVARGQTVLDVPTTATARVRELSRGGRRKTDVLDAAAAASVAALHGDTNPVAAEDQGTVLALLDERRANLTAARTRLINQLHALLRDLLPGGAPTELTAAKAAALLRGVRPVGPVERTRKDLARDLIAEIRGIDARLAAGARQMGEALREHGSRLPTVAGVGPVLAARLIGRTGRPSRFPTASAFATYAGVAPIDVASGDRARHRLSRHGDRQLNAALYLVALTQARMPDSPGRAYYDRKIAEGKTRNEAMRCLKRRLANHIWHTMISDERRASSPPDGQAAG
jgi:transposase